MHYGKLGFTALLPACLLLAMPAPSAQAQNLIRVNGELTQSLSGHSVLKNADPSLNKFTGLKEQTKFLNSLTVNTSSGGTTTLGAGTFTSFLVYTDPGKAGPTTYNITLTSNQKILGVISSSALLTATDTTLGLSSVLYPTGDALRGQEGADRFTLNTLTNRLTINNVTSGDVDEIRVIVGTLAVPELSTFIGFGSFIAMGGLAAARKRKRQPIA